jgi:hypothetical protein
MLELGFAVQTKEGVFEYTHPERIINIDESELDAKVLAELDQKDKQYLTEEGQRA